MNRLIGHQEYNLNLLYMATITTLLAWDTWPTSRWVINTNFTNINNELTTASSDIDAVQADIDTLEATRVLKSGDTMTGQLKLAKGSDIASATTTDLWAATGNYVDVTGTTSITGLGTVASGTTVTVRFTGALILTYNATSLILPTLANITTVSGDVATFTSLGSGNWRCTNYTRADGSPLAAVTITVLPQTYKPLETDLLLVDQSGNKKMANWDLFNFYCWDWADWDVTISWNTTLSSDKYYNDLTINNGVVLDPAGYKIYVRGTFTNNGTVRRNGNAGSAGTANGSGWTGWTGWAALGSGSLGTNNGGGAGGNWGAQIQTWNNWTAWTASNPCYVVTNGIAWANGGAWLSWGGGGTGWTAGAATRWGEYATIYNIRDLLSKLSIPSIGYSNSEYAIYKWLPWTGGGGGGGGGASGGGSCGWGGGGGSGWNGGIIFIAANIFNNAGAIEAIWWNGGAGWNGSAAGSLWGGGGGGSGWSGWVAYLVYRTLTALWTITLTWWTGAAGGTGAVAGGTGSTGATGTTIQVQIP